MLHNIWYHGPSPKSAIVLSSSCRSDSLRMPQPCSVVTFVSTFPVLSRTAPILRYMAFYINKLTALPVLLCLVCLAMLLSDVCLSVAYIGPNSRTERPRKTKIGTEVAHVTLDSDTTFKVKGQLVADVLNSQHAETGAT